MGKRKKHKLFSDFDIVEFIVEFIGELIFGLFD